jgi:hypothetical protein
MEKTYKIRLTCDQVYCAYVEATNEAEAVEKALCETDFVIADWEVTDIEEITE